MSVFELGGVGSMPGRTTVNLVPPADIICDILDVDHYCDDGLVSAFVLCHTLEHVPSQHYVQFLKDLHRKLVPGGYVEVVQTDVARLLAKGLPLRVARLPIFTPAHRLRENPYHQHFNMWSEDLLWEDFEILGYTPVEAFDAGSWKFDQLDELHPDLTQGYHGTLIPNLGIRAHKRAE